MDEEIAGRGRCPSSPTIASYGGGVNSTAMLVGLVRRGERPDAILFADTGGEKPHTYRFLDLFSQWLQESGFPPITVVSASFKRYSTLEENCLANATLPSIAFGFKTCSHKWKKEPQEKWANSWPVATEAWAAGGKVTKLLGFDADEPQRAGIPEDAKYVYRYPLIEWEWGRDECVTAIQDAGLPDPGKSACFFCPSSKRSEIRALRKHYPELFDRAVAMEANAAANLGNVKGLGRDWAWGDFIQADESQMRLFDERIDLPCGCYDGD